MESFQQLKVWQNAHTLTLKVYEITNVFPKSELFGLTSQLRQASASISANIAEGWARNSDADFARFCKIALGSTSELENHLLLARDLKFIETEQQMELSGKALEIRRMLIKLIVKLKA